MIDRGSNQTPMKLPGIQEMGESYIKETMIEKIHLLTEGLIPINQLKDLIIEAIKDKSGSLSKFSLTYVKLLTQRINNLEMPEGYQPRKFEQFDGKGNLKQHITYFIETCNDAEIYGDYLIKLFI